MRAKNVEDVYRLTPMQQGLLFHTLYRPEAGEYVVQFAFDLIGPLRPADLERAWREVVDRHPALRTSFHWQGLERPVQVVHREVPLVLAERDWRSVPAAEHPARLDALLREDRRQGFDLSAPPLVRLILVRLAEEMHVFLLSHHHLLLDGWSLPLVIREVFALYEASGHGRCLTLERPRPFRDYIAWLQRQDAARAESFWRGFLAGFSAPTPLGIGGPASAEDQKGYAEVRRALSAEAAAALQGWSRRHQLTASVLMQGAWAAVLARYSGEEELLFGAAVSGRPAEIAGVERMIGLFINTLPVRLQLRRDVPALAQLQQIQAAQAELLLYEYSALPDIRG